MEPIVIKQKASGNLLYAFGALIMSLSGLFLFFFDFQFGANSGMIGLIFQSILFLLKAIFLIGFVFFGYGFLFFLKRSQSKKDILIVDEAGITDNSSAIAFGFIPWSDIEGIYIGTSMNNDFIQLRLKNEEEYLKKLSGLKKQLVLANRKMGFEAVCITLNTTGVSPHDIFPEILKRFESAR